ncbi:MAG: flagellin FliC [Nitrospinaceae bacterium]|nr:flagellin FliC [Nitrospinaceae bacterium]NIR56806.1 flagellin FliC [Nitrospinaceae bacterium]NIS87262.1 flagellin FliC [Nitrospinaceae bacterium]NIT84115.1 flagellin FliC [Nitrospinaceae bacterium]NIU46303.1 flagellin FliC [Nitrospinaceae bacterium]
MTDFFNPAITGRLLNSITRNHSGLQNSVSKVASGIRLINASVDPAGLSLSEKLRSDIRVLGQAIRDTESGAGFLNVAESGLSAISDLLTRGRELAFQAAGGTLGDDQRQALNQEFQQIVAEIDRIAQSTQFNGQNLLNGDLAPAAPPVEIQVGIGANDRIALNVIDAVDATALGLAGLDLSTAAGAQAALNPLDAAGQTILDTRSSSAALAGRLESVVAASQNHIIELTAARSQIADADLAQEVSDLSTGLLRLQASIRALALQNRESADNVGRLLNIRA